MPEYLSPGVYVEEVSSGIKPIEGVGTSTGAFVGRAVKGPVGEPVLVTNPTQFADAFGGFHPNALLAYTARHFFLEGGTRCYVVRVFRPAGTGTLDSSRATVLLMDGPAPGAGSTDPPPVGALRVKALNPGAWGNDLIVELTEPAFDPSGPHAEEQRFGLVVKHLPPGAAEAEVLESYPTLTLDEFNAAGLPHPLHVEQVINGASRYIEVDDVGVATQVSTSGKVVPKPFLAAATVGGKQVMQIQLADGSDGVTPTKGDLLAGLQKFDTVDEINIVAIPDLVKLAAGDLRDGTLDAITYCQNRKDCFFVADPPEKLTPQQVLDYRRGTAVTGKWIAGSAFNSSFGALYYPWIWVADPVTGGRIPCPPSGAIAGSYSGTDVRRGVHKAPAGTEDGFLNAALDVELVVTKGEQDTLNPQGVNVIRKFPEAGVVIWGARTLSADPEWKYVNVRRLFLFLEESIFKGTQWVVFEPNDEVLWKRIVRNVSAFLRVQWSEGKLVGGKQEEAFFVKCDSETNPPESVDLGRVITLIGVAPSKPAEFVIFRISQFRPGAGA